MAKRRGREPDDVPELLKDLLITQLGVAGVPQKTIRKIVGSDINRVSRIVKHLKAARKNQRESDTSLVLGTTNADLWQREAN